MMPGGALNRAKVLYYKPGFVGGQRDSEFNISLDNEMASNKVFLTESEL